MEWGVEATRQDESRRSFSCTCAWLLDQSLAGQFESGFA